VIEELRRMALFGSGVAELTKSRAEQIVKDLVQAGDVKRKQASAIVKDLMEASRANREELLRFVRGEVQSQTENLGLATKRDVDRLERRVTRLEVQLAARPAARKKTAKKTTAKKTTARKSTNTPSGPPITPTEG
jgi:polyhydroxyalkanoate synthesis regulator phasin